VSPYLWRDIAAERPADVATTIVMIVPFHRGGGGWGLFMVGLPKKASGWQTAGPSGRNLSKEDLRLWESVARTGVAEHPEARRIIDQIRDVKARFQGQLLPSH
jgi:hypothetical protein